MFDVLAEQTDTKASTSWFEMSADKTPMTSSSLTASTSIADVDGHLQTYRDIKVLLVETDTGAAFSITEQCLRYMTRFECLITQAGTCAAASFALSADTFDIVIADQNCLDLIAATSRPPVIVVTATTGSDTTRRARKAGALHCLPLEDLSPRLLETAISQAIRGEQAMS
jgi:DNA-binding NarL/FixJ family response regulator